jgi:hypothetical protein
MLLIHSSIVWGCKCSLNSENPHPADKVKQWITFKPLKACSPSRNRFFSSLPPLLSVHTKPVAGVLILPPSTKRQPFEEVFLPLFKQTVKIHKEKSIPSSY